MPWKPQQTWIDNPDCCVKYERGRLLTTTLTEQRCLVNTAGGGAGVAGFGQADPGPVPVTDEALAISHGSCVVLHSRLNESHVYI